MSQRDMYYRKPNANEEMKKHSLRGKLFALLFPKMNDRWATFTWG